MTYVPLLDTSIDLRKTVPRVLIDFSKTDDVAQDMIRELSVLKRKIKGSSGSVLVSDSVNSFRKRTRYNFKKE